MNENTSLYSVKKDYVFKDSISSNKVKGHYYNVKKWSFFHRMVYRSFLPILTNIIPTFFRFEIFGAENLKKFNWNKPLILAGNHRSHLDALVGFAGLFAPRGPLRYVPSISYGDILQENLLFKMMGYLGGYPIDRKNPEASLDFLYETLQNDLPIAIFPQGGRIARTPLEDYQKLSEEGKSGIGRLVLRTKCNIPVIPVYLHGTAEALSKGSKKPKFGSYVSITFGNPIYFNEFADQELIMNSQSFYNTSRIITNNVMKKIQDLCYKTEKELFKLIEKKINRPFEQIILSDRQSRNLRTWLRRFSHIPPYEL